MVYSKTNRSHRNKSIHTHKRNEIIMNKRIKQKRKKPVSIDHEYQAK